MRNCLAACPSSYWYSEVHSTKDAFLSFHFDIFHSVCNLSSQFECVLWKKYAQVFVKWSEGAQSCPTLCDSMDCCLLGDSPWSFSGKSTGVGRHFLVQGIFPTQGLKLGLPHCRQMLYHLSHREAVFHKLREPSQWLWIAYESSFFIYLCYHSTHLCLY